jgi:hypothetical protein
MKPNDLVKFKHPIKEEQEEDLIMKVLWIDNPRIMVEYLNEWSKDKQYLSTHVYNIEDLELITK